MRRPMATQTPSCGIAHRIADMDRRKVPWRKYFFVNINYKPFDAAQWKPMPSGRFGPVRLIPCTHSADAIDQ